MAGGALGERIGKRTTFLGGVALFTIGSAACAAAPDLGFLLRARAVQAVGVAALIPQTLSILVTEYADPARRARAVGIWAGAASLGLAAGPVVGGAITSVANWRAGFWLSVVLGVVTVALGLRVISRARYGRPMRPATPDLAGRGAVGADAGRAHVRPHRVRDAGLGVAADHRRARPRRGGRGRVHRQQRPRPGAAGSR